MTRPILIAFFYSISILPNSLFGANSATAIVTFGIDSILEMSVSGNPGVLNIYDAQAGSQPEPAVDRTTSYAITTNNTAQKITVVMDTSLPIGVNLSVELTPPAGAISFGQINLSTTPQMAVVNISSIAESGLPITYIFSAAVTTAPFGPIFRTVTYTIGP